MYGVFFGIVFNFSGVFVSVLDMELLDFFILVSWIEDIFFLFGKFLLLYFVEEIFLSDFGLLLFL